MRGFPAEVGVFQTNREDDRIAVVLDVVVATGECAETQEARDVGVAGDTKACLELEEVHGLAQLVFPEAFFRDDPSCACSREVAIAVVASKLRTAIHAQRGFEHIFIIQLIIDPAECRNKRPSIQRIVRFDRVAVFSAFPIQVKLIVHVAHLHVTACALHFLSFAASHEAQLVVFGQHVEVVFGRSIRVPIHDVIVPVFSDHVPIGPEAVFEVIVTQIHIIQAAIGTQGQILDRGILQINGVDAAFLDAAPVNLSAAVDRVAATKCAVGGFFVEIRQCIGLRHSQRTVPSLTDLVVAAISTGGGNAQLQILEDVPVNVHAAGVAAIAVAEEVALIVHCRQVHIGLELFGSLRHREVIFLLDTCTCCQVLPIGRAVCEG